VGKVARTLVINPRSDLEFVTAVEVEGPGAPSPDTLADHLREAYPRVIVRPRLLANEPHEIWYVYRDGHWVRSE
jgi:hypothetical protein